MSCGPYKSEHALQPPSPALQITSLFQWGFRTYAELQNHFVSVERAMAYTRIPQEPAANLPGDAALAAAAWPQRGAVSFSGACMRYRPELPLALNNLNLEIEPGLKTAFVGRTGALASALPLALDLNPCRCNLPLIFTLSHASKPTR